VGARTAIGGRRAALAPGAPVLARLGRGPALDPLPPRGRGSLTLPMPPTSAAHPVDQRLLEMLERSFADLAGDDARIDAAELQRALGLRSEYLARRVLRAFDRDGDGVIGREEFLTAVRGLVFGTARDKLRFAFAVHDHDGDGGISHEEMLRMITLGLAEDEVTLRPGDADRLARALFLAADRNRDGVISFDELEAIVRHHPGVLEQITRSGARWIAPNEDVLARLDARPRPRLRRLLENRALPLAFLGLFAAANVALFVLAVVRYRDRGANEFVQIARGAGACINLDGALILVPMMRRTLTWARRTALGRIVPIDDAIDFHRVVGHTMFAFGLIHTAAHLTNYAVGTKAPFVDQLFGTRAGITGFVLLLVFAVMWFFARSAVRRSGRFELFYFTHLLYVEWLALALVHGPVFWIWAAAPIAGYAVERALQVARRVQATEIVAGHALRSGVTRLEIRRPPGFAHRAGEYLFLCIPALAKHEWHPFTISSAPEREALTVHVRSLGNWTSALRRLVEDKHARGANEPLVARIDGPYGTPTADIFESRHAVLIGAGIGVTPFASVLESIVMRAAGQSPQPSSLEKAYFFWLAKDQYSFEWFTALLAHLEAIDARRLLDVTIVMTAGRGDLTSAALGVARDVLHAMGYRDLLTGLRTKTQMGDPDWRRVLGEIARRHAPAPVDVYFCGPHGLGKKLSPLCAELGMRFRDERF